MSWDFMEKPDLCFLSFKMVEEGRQVWHFVKLPGFVLLVLKVMCFGALDGGSPMSHVDFTKCQRQISLSHILRSRI